MKQTEMMVQDASCTIILRALAVSPNILDQQ